MTTNLSLSQGLANAQTSFETAFQGLYSGGMPGPWSEWTHKISGSTKTVSLNWLANHPVMRKWSGARIEKFLRHYAVTATLEKFEATLPIERMDLQYEGGMAIVGDAIQSYLRNNLAAYDKSVADELDGYSGVGPTCFDGQALFSTAHPHGPSAANQSNYSSGTNLTWANFDTARAAMASLKLENGEPAYIRATHMRVGTALERRAKEILKADTRLVGTDTSGAETTTAISNMNTFQNIWQGELTLIVDPRIPASGTGAFYWDLYDLSKPGIRPMVMYEGRAPTAVNQTEMEGERRFNTDQFVFGLEGDWTVIAGHWMTAYRATGTA